jgi:hypothetical protein
MSAPRGLLAMTAGEVAGALYAELCTRSMVPAIDAAVTAALRAGGLQVHATRAAAATAARIQTLVHSAASASQIANFAVVAAHEAALVRGAPRAQTADVVAEAASAVAIRYGSDFPEGTQDYSVAATATQDQVNEKSFPGQATVAGGDAAGRVVAVAADHAANRVVTAAYIATQIMSDATNLARHIVAGRISARAAVEMGSNSSSVGWAAFAAFKEAAGQPTEQYASLDDIATTIGHAVAYSHSQSGTKISTQSEMVAIASIAAAVMQDVAVNHPIPADYASEVKRTVRFMSLISQPFVVQVMPSKSAIRIAATAAAQAAASMSVSSYSGSSYSDVGTWCSEAAKQTGGTRYSSLFVCVRMFVAPVKCVLNWSCAVILLLTRSAPVCFRIACVSAAAAAIEMFVLANTTHLFTANSTAVSAGSKMATAVENVVLAAQGTTAEAARYAGAVAGAQFAGGLRKSHGTFGTAMLSNVSHIALAECLRVCQGSTRSCTVGNGDGLQSSCACVAGRAVAAALLSTRQMDSNSTVEIVFACVDDIFRRTFGQSHIWQVYGIALAGEIGAEYERALGSRLQQVYRAAAQSARHVGGNSAHAAAAAGAAAATWVLSRGGSPQIAAIESAKAVTDVSGSPDVRIACSSKAAAMVSISNGEAPDVSANTSALAAQSQGGGITHIAAAAAAAHASALLLKDGVVTPTALQAIIVDSAKIGVFLAPVATTPRGCVGACYLVEPEQCTPMMQAIQASATAVAVTHAPLESNITILAERAGALVIAAIDASGDGDLLLNKPAIAGFVAGNIMVQYYESSESLQTVSRQTVEEIAWGASVAARAAAINAGGDPAQVGATAGFALGAVLCERQDILVWEIGQLVFQSSNTNSSSTQLAAAFAGVLSARVASTRKFSPAETAAAAGRAVFLNGGTFAEAAAMAVMAAPTHYPDSVGEPQAPFICIVGVGKPDSRGVLRAQVRRERELWLEADAYTYSNASLRFNWIISPDTGASIEFSNSAIAQQISTGNPRVIRLPAYMLQACGVYTVTATVAEIGINGDVPRYSSSTQISLEVVPGTLQINPPHGMARSLSMDQQGGNSFFIEYDAKQWVRDLDVDPSQPIVSDSSATAADTTYNWTCVDEHPDAASIDFQCASLSAAGNPIPYTSDIFSTAAANGKLRFHLGLWVGHIFRLSVSVTKAKRATGSNEFSCYAATRSASTSFTIQVVKSALQNNPAQGSVLEATQVRIPFTAAHTLPSTSSHGTYVTVSGSRPLVIPGFLSITSVDTSLDSIFGAAGWTEMTGAVGTIDAATTIAPSTFQNPKGATYNCNFEWSACSYQGEYSIPLFLRPGSLSPGRVYRFRLSVTRGTTQSARETFFSEISVIANLPPAQGSVQITPSRGIALTTEYFLSAASWAIALSSGDNGLPLRYRFHLKSDQRVNDLQLSIFSGKNYLDGVILPPAGQNTIAQQFVRVHVADVFEAETTSSVPVQVDALPTSAVVQRVMELSSSFQTDPVLRNSAEVLRRVLSAATALQVAGFSSSVTNNSSGTNNNLAEVLALLSVSMVNAVNASEPDDECLIGSPPRSIIGRLFVLQIIRALTDVATTSAIALRETALQVLLPIVRAPCAYRSNMVENWEADEQMRTAPERFDMESDRPTQIQAEQPQAEQLLDGVAQTFSNLMVGTSNYDSHVAGMADARLYLRTLASYISNLQVAGAQPVVGGAPLIDVLVQVVSKVSYVSTLPVEFKIGGKTATKTFNAGGVWSSPAFGREPALILPKQRVAISPSSSILTNMPLLEQCSLSSLERLSVVLTYSTSNFNVPPAQTYLPEGAPASQKVADMSDISFVSASLVTELNRSLCFSFAPARGVEPTSDFSFGRVVKPSDSCTSLAMKTSCRNNHEARDSKLKRCCNSPLVMRLPADGTTSSRILGWNMRQAVCAQFSDSSNEYSTTSVVQLGLGNTHNDLNPQYLCLSMVTGEHSVLSGDGVLPSSEPNLSIVHMNPTEVNFRKFIVNKMFFLPVFILPLVSCMYLFVWFIVRIADIKLQTKIESATLAQMLEGRVFMHDWRKVHMHNFEAKGKWATLIIAWKRFAESCFFAHSWIAMITAPVETRAVIPRSQRVTIVYLCVLFSAGCTAMMHGRYFSIVKDPEDWSGMMGVWKMEIVFVTCIFVMGSKMVLCHILPFDFEPGHAHTHAFGGEAVDVADFGIKSVSVGLHKVPVDLKNPCVICQDEFFKGDLVKTLTCGHYFHKPCVDGWLTKSAADAFTETTRPPDCPFCKKSVIGMLPLVRELHVARSKSCYGACLVMLVVLWVLTTMVVCAFYMLHMDAGELSCWIVSIVLVNLFMVFVFEPLYVIFMLWYASKHMAVPILEVPDSEVLNPLGTKTADEKAIKKRRKLERKEMKAANLPYGGDISAAMKMQDRDAIRQIMQARNTVNNQSLGTDEPDADDAPVQSAKQETAMSLAHDEPEQDTEADHGHDFEHHDEHHDNGELYFEAEEELRDAIEEFAPNLEAAFKKMDLNNDDTVSQMEFSQALSAMGLHLDGETSEHLWECIDANKDRKITFAELEEFMFALEEEGEEEHPHGHQHGHKHPHHAEAWHGDDDWHDDGHQEDWNDDGHQEGYHDEDYHDEDYTDDSTVSEGDTGHTSASTAMVAHGDRVYL